MYWPDGYLQGMSVQQIKAKRFLALHHAATPLLLPNPWDAGSAKLLASLGFEALATTSGGFAATSAGSMGRSAATRHSITRGRSVSATDVPVSADLENVFADQPARVAETVSLAIETGLAGCSVEDFTGHADAAIYDMELAVERVAAVAEQLTAARCISCSQPERRTTSEAVRTLLTPSPGFRPMELQEQTSSTPGLTQLEDIRRLVSEVEQPVNVLALPGAPSVSALGDVGVSRISGGKCVRICSPRRSRRGGPRAAGGRHVRVLDRSDGGRGAGTRRLFNESVPPRLRGRGEDRGLGVHGIAGPPRFDPTTGGSQIRRTWLETFYWPVQPPAGLVLEHSVAAGSTG